MRAYTRPTPGNLSTCRKCGETIIFVITPGAKLMPVDAAVDEAGTVACRRDANGQWIGRVLRKGEIPDRMERLHVTHFASCKPPAAIPTKPVGNVIPFRRPDRGR